MSGGHEVVPQQAKEVQSASPSSSDASPESTVLEHPILRNMGRPDKMTPEQILSLQRKVGNQAVMRMLGKTSRPNSPILSPVQRVTLEQANKTATSEKVESSIEEIPSTENPVELAPVEPALPPIARMPIEEKETQPAPGELIDPSAFEVPSVTHRAPVARSLIQRQDEGIGGNARSLGGLLKRGIVDGQGYGEQTDSQKEKEQWVHASMMVNSPIMPGGIGHYIQYKILKKRMRDDVEHSKGAINKSHILEENMYGTGPIGWIFRTLALLSRGMHLIAGLAGLGALALGIAGLWYPFLLPIATIFSLIAFAANSAIVLLKSILIARNIYRIVKMPGEKDKILPTLYRDIAGLVVGIIGVALGGGFGFGGGSFLHVGSQAALEGAERAVHIADLASVGTVEGSLAAINTGVTLQQDMNEVRMGREGRFDHPEYGKPKMEIDQIEPVKVGGAAGSALLNPYFEPTIHYEDGVHGPHSGHGGHDVPDMPEYEDSVSEIGGRSRSNSISVSAIEADEDADDEEDNNPTVPESSGPVVPPQQGTPDSSTVSLNRIPGSGSSIQRTLSPQTTIMRDGSETPSEDDGKLVLKEMAAELKSEATSDKSFNSQRLRDLDEAKGGLTDVGEATNKAQDAMKIEEASKEVEQSESKIGGDGDNSKMPKNETELRKQEADVMEVEATLGVEEPKKKQSVGSKIKSGLKKMGAWIAKRFFKLKNRIVKAYRAFNAKLMRGMLNLMGFKKDLEAMDTAVAEQKTEAPKTAQVLNAGQTSIDEYEKGAQQLSEIANRSDGKK